MAEFLILKDDNTHKDPEKDKRQAKAGDVIEVYKDGRCEKPPHKDSRYYIVKVPGMKFEEALKYMEQDKTLNGEEWIQHRIRKYKFDKTKMTSAEISTVDTSKEISLTELKIITYINKKEALAEI